MCAAAATNGGNPCARCDERSAGMGSFTAIGGLKDGVKRVTAFETADCATALAVAKFRSFGKPGVSSYVVRDLNLSHLFLCAFLQPLVLLFWATRWSIR